MTQIRLLGFSTLSYELSTPALLLMHLIMGLPQMERVARGNFWHNFLSHLWYNLCILPIFDPILTQKWGKKCMKNTGLNKNCVCSQLWNVLNKLNERDPEVLHLYVKDIRILTPNYEQEKIINKTVKFRKLVITLMQWFQLNIWYIMVSHFTVIESWFFIIYSLNLRIKN